MFFYMLPGIVAEIYMLITAFVLISGGGSSMENLIVAVIAAGATLATALIGLIGVTMRGKKNINATINDKTVALSKEHTELKGVLS